MLQNPVMFISPKNIITENKSAIQVSQVSDTNLNAQVSTAAS